jgi:hypothetical protein
MIFIIHLKTDVHVQVDGKFKIAIECKAYTENAMLKRILVDFTLFKQVYPDLAFVLFQLESQLGGDYLHLLTTLNMVVPLHIPYFHILTLI